MQPIIRAEITCKRLLRYRIALFLHPFFVFCLGLFCFFAVTVVVSSSHLLIAAFPFSFQAVSLDCVIQNYERKKKRSRVITAVVQLFSWCFEHSQPQRIISGLVVV